jgi:hypothetical protein
MNEQRNDGEEAKKRFVVTSHTGQIIRQEGQDVQYFVCINSREQGAWVSKDSMGDKC